MYANLKIFFEAERLAFFKQRFRLRRWLVVLFFTLIFWSFWCVVAIGQMLDHVLFPRFRKQEVEDPIFIVAPPRSGTTFLQNLLCLDSERFTYVRLYQTIFPAVVFQRCFDLLGWIDRRCGRIFSRLVAWSDKKFFGGWDDIHPMGLNRPEEDEAYFVYTFVADSIYLLFPYPEELRIAGFADALPAKSRRRLMRFYKGCLQRHVYATGPRKTLLTKNTPLSGRIDSMLEAFPDARVISIIRHPDKSVPSHVSPFYQVWKAHSPEIAKDSPESKKYAMLAVDWYRHLFGNRHRFDPSRHILVKYVDLVTDPTRTVERIYTHFGMDLSPAFRERLQEATGKSREFRSNHRYTLEEYGLSREWIRKELGDLIDAYGLEEDAAGSAPGSGPQAPLDSTRETELPIRAAAEGTATRL
jgi:hypothetical protein